MAWTKTAKTMPSPVTKKKVTTPKPVNKYSAYGQTTGSINTNQYGTKPVTINDLKGMGFDYSKAYANQQAQAEGDAQRSGLNAQMKQVDAGVKGANDNLSREYFQKYMQQAQNQVNSGVNGGVQADQNLRMAMSRQSDMGNIYRDAAVQKNKIQGDLTNVNTQQVAKANQIYNDRLQQGFQNALNQTSSNRQENQAMLSAALQQRGQNIQKEQWDKNFNNLSASEKAQLSWEKERYKNMSASEKAQLEWAKEQFADNKKWREHTFNNMSASEKAQLEWAKKQYGEDAAWRLYAMQYEGELARSQSQAELDLYKNSGFSGGSGGGGYTNNYKTQGQASKSGSFKTYQSHLQQAISKGGVPASWASALTELVGRESSWNSSAKNPNSTAHGYGQFLNSTRANYEKKTGLSYSNPVNQLIMMAQYVKDRYGTPEKALAFWDKNKWY